MTITYKEGRLTRTQTRECKTKKDRTKFQAEITKAGKIIVSIKD